MSHTAMVHLRFSTCKSAPVLINAESPMPRPPGPCSSPGSMRTVDVGCESRPTLLESLPTDVGKNEQAL